MLSRAGAGSLYSPDLPTGLFGRYFTFSVRKRPFFPAPCPYGKTAVCPPALQTATDNIPTNARLRPNQCLLLRPLTPVCNAIRHLLEMRLYTAD